MATILASDPGLAILGWALGGLWTAFRASDWFARLRNDRLRKAIDALEAGIDIAYRTYVQAIKAAREDGKLTVQECREARRRAREAAIQFGRSQGVDVLRELGADYIDMWIERILRQVKEA
jgi:hypothetical protein